MASAIPVDVTPEEAEAARAAQLEQAVAEYPDKYPDGVPA